MNAKRLIVTLVFIAILLGCIVWMTDVFIQDAGRKNKIWREQSQKVTDAITYINSRQLDVMYYGEDLKAPESFSVRHIYNFNQDSLRGDENVPEHLGHMLIINDPAGSLKMTKEDWLDVLHLLKHEAYVIVYLGSAQLKTMQDTGYFFDVYPEGTHSVVFWNYGKGQEIGFADDPMIIPEVVRETLTSDQLPVYAMLLQMHEKQYI